MNCIEIKPPDVYLFGKEKDFLKLWREKTKSLPGLVVNFKDKKVGIKNHRAENTLVFSCLLYTSPSPRDLSTSRMPSSA